MAIIYTMCGLPGSFKSTWAKRKAKEDTYAMIITREMYRNTIKGDYVFDWDYEPAIKEATMFSIRTFINRNWDVIIDDCHLTVKARAEIIGAFPSHQNVLVWCIESERNEAIRSIDHKGKGADYWIDVISKMRSSYEEPLMSEGFSDIVKFDGTFTGSLV